MYAINTWDTIFLVIEFVVCLLGIVFNGLVILTICRSIHHLSSPSYLILSIAISDFISCSVAVPFSIARHFREGWPFGMAGCKAHAFMIFLFALVSITHLANISAGKYLNITRSLYKNSYFSKRQILLVILASWIFSLGFSIAPLLGWSRYGLEGTNATCSIKWESTRGGDKAYFGIVFIACYVFPIAVITFSYYKIHKVSRGIVRTSSQIGCIGLTMTQALLRKHRKSAMYYLAIIIAFMVSWSPYAVVSFLAVIGRKVHPIAASTCSVFAKISFILNPILYAIFSRKFRRRMVRVVPMTRPNREVRPTTCVQNSATLALWKLSIWQRES